MVTSGRLVPLMPPLRLPSLAVIAHSVLSKLAVKLPLLCANAGAATARRIGSVNVTGAGFLMALLLSRGSCGVGRTASSDSGVSVPTRWVCLKSETGEKNPKKAGFHDENGVSGARTRGRKP